MILLICGSSFLVIQLKMLGRTRNILISQ